VEDWDANFLHAHLLATSDPQSAAAGFRRVVGVLVKAAARTEVETQAMFDALWNVLLLEVRGRQIEAADAWDSLRRYLRPESDPFLSTPAHRAVIAEVALRAGDLEGALEARGQIPPDAAHLTQPLDRLLKHMSS
jgi:hypothetical protein